MGAVSAELFSGAMEATTVPDCPGVRDRVAGATVIWKSGVPEACARTRKDCESEARCDSSPVYVAAREWSPAGRSRTTSGLALGVERGAGQLAAKVANGYGTGGGKAIISGDGDGNSGLGAAGVVVCLNIERGLRGLGLRGQVLLILRGKRQCGHRQCHADCCNQLKPQTAADHTSHVHLLQISRKNACCRVAES
jgi:hypothetical protein